jgi:hypothetical protein
LHPRLEERLSIAIIVIINTDLIGMNEYFKKAAHTMTITIDPELLSANLAALRPATIEKVFTDCALDLKQILVLDGSDILPDGFRIRCHDLHRQFPAPVIKNSGDTFQDKDRLSNEACKLIAIVKLRDEMVSFLPGCKLLPPANMDGKAIAGLQAKPKTWIAEGEDFLEAYHELHRQVVG